MDGQRIDIYGWAEASANASSAAITNLPMGWDDRSNRVELQQFFVRIERQVVTTGTTMPTWGFRSDWLIGTDYRWTLPRGIWNSQLINSKTDHRPHRAEPLRRGPGRVLRRTYVPTVLQRPGCQGRPLVRPLRRREHRGRQHAAGVAVLHLQQRAGVHQLRHPGHAEHRRLRHQLLNAGPDRVDPVPAATPSATTSSQDAGAAGRFVGYVKWVQPGSLATPVYGRNTVTLATTIGCGQVQHRRPLRHGEPRGSHDLRHQRRGAERADRPAGGAAGRNNINVVDLLYTHTFNPVLNYAAETSVRLAVRLPARPGPQRQRHRLLGVGVRSTCSTPCRRG